MIALPAPMGFAISEVEYLRGDKKGHEAMKNLHFTPM
jgi:hypothetical protein